MSPSRIGHRPPVTGGSVPPPHTHTTSGCVHLGVWLPRARRTLCQNSADDPPENEAAPLKIAPPRSVMYAVCGGGATSRVGEGVLTGSCTSARAAQGRRTDPPVVYVVVWCISMSCCQTTGDGRPVLSQLGRVC